MALALDDWWCNRLLDVILLFNNTEVVDEFREVLDFVVAGLKDPDKARCDHYLLQPTIPKYHSCPNRWSLKIGGTEILSQH